MLQELKPRMAKIRQDLSKNHVFLMEAAPFLGAEEV